MPRPGPRRPQVAVRLSEAGIARVDERAAKRGVSRSEMLRLMVAYADLHMPVGWQPRKAAEKGEQ